MSEPASERSAYRTLDVTRTGMVLAVDMWSYVCPANEVAATLRQIADRLDETDGCLLGLWSTGFEGPEEAVLQVIVDMERGASSFSGRDVPEPIYTEAEGLHLSQNMDMQ